MSAAVAIIPARGGSKRIPRKNILTFAGLPMIAHSIGAAIASSVFDRVIVSTDDEEIAAIAVKAGAECPFIRPAELSDEHTATAPVVLHAIKWLAEHDTSPAFACCIYATAPFILPDDLRRGLDILKSRKAATAFSVTTFEFPIFRALRVGKNGALEMFWPEHELSRSQDLPEAFHDAGQFYWIDVARFLETPQLYSAESMPVMIPRHRVQDIDTPEDWKRAELMFRLLEQERLETRL
jgi:pseudaminic acid cytidylyltransferase